MKKCPTCGNTIFGPMDEYCYRDGSKAVHIAEPVCECGRTLDSPDKFCPKCGKEVGNGSNADSPA